MRQLILSWLKHPAFLVVTTSGKRGIKEISGLRIAFLSGLIGSRVRKVDYDNTYS